MSRSGLCFVVLSLGALSAQSDPFVRDERKQHLPDLVWIDPPHLLDVDGDGDLDAVVSAGRDRQLHLLLNLGRFRFVDVSSSSMPPLTGLVLASADADGDGDLDLFCDGPRLLLNDGAGGFVNASVGRLPLLPDATRGFAVGDIDGDGDVDAFVGTATGAWIYRNDGTGVFQPTAAPPEARAAVLGRLADLDGDRDLDLVVLANPGVAVLRNDGRGGLTPIAGALTLPPVVLDLALADVDRDGDLDLIAGSYIQPGASRHLHLNDGQGRFTDVTATHLPATTAAITNAIVVRDLDGDRDTDLLLGQNDFQSEVLLNDGTGRFVLGDAGDLRSLLSASPALGDLDGDGLADVLIGPSHVLAGRVGGAFALLDPAAIEADSQSMVAVLDLDGDGDADVLQGWGGFGQTYGSGGLVAKRNDGTGTFRPTHYSAPLPAGTSATTVGDVDGDGDPDVLHSVRLSPTTTSLHVLHNRGDGSFAPASVTTSFPGAPVALYLDDVDGDGDPDAIDVGLGGVTVLHNDGRGGFTLGRTTSTVVYDSDLFDYDGDGDGDLFLQSTELKLLENQAGTFVDVTHQRFAFPLPYGVPRLMRVETGTWLLVVRGDVKVFRLQGGSFAAHPHFDHTLFEEALGARVVPAGWNGEVASQLAVRVGRAMPTVRMLSFDGYSRVRDVTREVLDDVPFTDVRFAGDVDGDGDPDLIGERASRDWRVLRGTRRSFTAPYAAMLGMAFEYRLRDATVTTGNPALASLMFGSGLVRLPLSGIGILRIDPAVAVALPPAVLPVQGTLSMAFAIPADPALRDASVVAQPLTVYLRNGTVTLGAALRDVIR